MVRQFSHYNPEILGEVKARDMSLPEYDFDRAPPCLPAPKSDWKPPPVPFVDDWDTPDEVVRNYEAQIMVFPLVNAAQTLVRKSQGKRIGGFGNTTVDLSKVKLRDISIGLTDSATRLVVECSEAPGKIVTCQEWNSSWDSYSQTETDNFMGDTHEARKRAYLEDFKDKEARRRDKHCEMVARLSTLRHRETFSDAERRLRAKGVTSDEITQFASWLATEACDLSSLMQTADRGIKNEHALRLAAQEEL
jgi:hypothetical protein